MIPDKSNFAPPRKEPINLKNPENPKMGKDANEQDALLDHIIDSVIILDKEGKIKEINQAALNLLNYKSKEELLQKPMSSVCENFSLKEIMDKIPLQDYEMAYLDRQRKGIPVNVNITARRDSGGVIKDVIFVARKGPESPRSHLKLRDSEDELIRSERLAFTGRIAASIAHEIRNPLTNVSISIQQLKKAFEPKNPRFKHIEIITKNTERINYLITELLNCARPPKLNMRPYDIHKLLKDILESSKSKVESQRIKVVKEFTSESSTISMDKEHLERAFLNIVINAIEAMPKGGKLTIATEHEGDSFVAKIEDTGKGIPEEDIIKIFDPFFSSKSSGVGLGLTVCYGIIVSHGGIIEVESKPKKGALFTVTLPIG